MGQSFFAGLAADNGTDVLYSWPTKDAQGTEDAMNRFIQDTHIPSYANGMGRGTIPPDSPASGTLGTAITRTTPTSSTPGPAT